MSKRSCKRNKRKMYYALYSDKIPKLDENGDKTFEFTTGYSKPVPFEASLSAGSGSVDEGDAGTEIFHNRKISTSDLTLPVDSNSLFWIGKEPTYNEDGSVNKNSANYRANAPVLDGISTLVISIESNED